MTETNNVLLANIRVRGNQPLHEPLTHSHLIYSRRLVCVMLAILLAGACSTKPNYKGSPDPATEIVHGPYLGGFIKENPDDASQIIWARADGHGSLQVQYRVIAGRDRRIDRSGWNRSRAVPLRAGNDFTGIVNLRSLEPDTTYEYRLALNGRVEEDTLGTITTPPAYGDPCVLRFAVGADNRDTDRPFTIFDEIAMLDIAGMLLMGDQVYADSATTAAQYDAFYEKNFEDEQSECGPDNDESCGGHMKSFLANVGVDMIWDDHEITNNWSGGKGGEYAAARAAYDKWQHPFNLNAKQYGPDDDGDEKLYYSGALCGVGFFILDTRTYRSPNENADNANKTMLDQEQLDDLFDFLQTSKAKVNVIVSSVPWHDLAVTGNDAWQRFTTEREQIFDFIRNNCVEGVILLSGDQHHTAIAHMERTGFHPYDFYEFSPTPLGNSTNLSNPDKDDQILFRYNDGKVFGLVTIDTTADPATIMFNAFDENGEAVEDEHGNGPIELMRTTDQISGSLPPCDLAAGIAAQ